MKLHHLQKLLAILLVCSIGLSVPGTVLADEKQATEIPVLKLEDGFGMIEAEDCYYTENLSLRKASEASNGKYLYSAIPTSEPEERVKSQGGDDLRLHVEITETAYYTIWVRGWTATSAQTFWFSVDNETRANKWFSKTDTCQWVSVRTLELKPGIHEIGIIPRLFSTGVDKILITDSEIHVPTEMGQPPKKFILGKEGEDLETLRYPLPAYTPPAEHPRIFLREQDIPTIKENFTHEQNIKAWEAVQRIAASDKNCKMATGGGATSYSYDVNVHEYVECCAFMYAIDKQANLDYGYKAISGLHDYLSTVNLSADDALNLARSGILQYVAKVYDWCHDLLTDEQKEFFIKKGLLLATKTEIGWPPTLLNAFDSDHGGEGGLQVDLLSLAIATYEDYPDIWNAVAGRYFSQWIPINNFYYDQSSWQAEGDSYGTERFSYEAKGNALIDKMGLGGLVSPNEHYLGYQYIYRRRPDGNFMMDGDMWNLTFSKPAYKGTTSSLLPLSAKYDDPYLKYEMYKMEEGGMEADNSDQSYSYVDFLILNDVNVPIKSHEDLPLTMYTGEGHNMMTARTGWDDGLDSNTMVVSMKGGGRTRGGHMHLDAGNFTIYYKGPLALDSGIYNGQSFVGEDGKMVTNVQTFSYHNGNYGKRTIAHNCILVWDPNEPVTYNHREAELNDGGQIQGRNRVTGQANYEQATSDDKINSYRLGVDYGPDMNRPAYSYLKTDITNAYSEKMKEYQRTFLFQNFFDDTYPGALIVMDKVVSSNPDFEKNWLLHSQEEPVVDGTTTIIDRTEYGYNGRLVNETLLPKADDVILEKVGGPGKEYMVGDKNAKGVPKVVKGDESGKWRVEVIPKTAKTTDYFLNVMYVSDADDSIQPLESKLYETDGYAGVKIKDRVAYLSKQAARTSQDVLVYAEGEEETLQYVVDGLSTGKWNVVDENNQLLTTCEITEEGGVAYFVAKPGAYMLKKIRGIFKIPSKSFNILDALPALANPLDIKLCYNTMYEYIPEDEKFQELDGTVWFPMKSLLSMMDGYFEYSENGDDISMVFETNTYNLKVGSASATKKYSYMEKIEETLLSHPLQRINGKVYAPLSLLEELLGKIVTYDPMGKIVRLTNNVIESAVTPDTDPTRIVMMNAVGEDNYVDYPAFQALDGETGNQAGFNSVGSSMTFEFREIEELERISILWNDGKNRDYLYEFWVSEDGENFTKVKEGETGFTDDFADYTITPTKAKYVKIVGNGNKVNNWFVIKEIKFYKTEE